MNISVNNTMANMAPTIDAVNRETQIFNDIKKTGSEKAQLKKVSQEFESIFILRQHIFSVQNPPSALQVKSSE